MFSYIEDKTLLDLSYNLLYLIISHLHNTDILSLKRTNIEYDNIFNNCCDCETKRLDEFNIDLAARHGHLEVVEWLHNRRYTDNVFFSFLLSANPFYNNRNEGCTRNAMDYAARNGYLDVVKFLHNNRNEGCTIKAMDWAARCGHLDVVKFLHNNGKKCITNAMNWAAKYGHLDIVKFLHDNREEGCTTRAMDSAAWSGHLDIVIWLHNNRTEGCTTYAMNGATRNGHLDIVEYLHNNKHVNYAAVHVFEFQPDHNTIATGWN